MAFSVSHTTRAPRSMEQDGIDYYFTDKTRFAQMRENGLFLEWAEVHGNWYGTSKQTVQTAVDQGLDLLLDIDVQGAGQVREKLMGKHVSVFVAPPSLKELTKRLRGRSTEPEEAIATRLENARQEMKSMDRYHYFIVNDDMETAVKILQSVIIAERSRKRRDLNGVPLKLNF